MSKFKKSTKAPVQEEERHVEEEERHVEEEERQKKKDTPAMARRTANRPYVVKLIMTTVTNAVVPLQ